MCHESVDHRIDQAVSSIRGNDADLGAARQLRGRGCASPVDGSIDLKQRISRFHDPRPWDRRRNEARKVEFGWYSPTTPHVFPEQIRPEGTISKLLDCMDAHGIDRAVCFAPFPHHMAGAGMGNANAWLDGVISSHRDRLAAFGSVNPEAGDAPLEVSRLVDMGVKGIKLHPAAQEFAINSRRARPFYEAALRRRNGTYVPYRRSLGADYQDGGRRSSMTCCSTIPAS